MALAITNGRAKIPQAWLQSSWNRRAGHAARRWRSTQQTRTARAKPDRIMLDGSGAAISVRLKKLVVAPSVIAQPPFDTQLPATPLPYQTVLMAEPIDGPAVVVPGPTTNGKMRCQGGREPSPGRRSASWGCSGPGNRKSHSGFPSHTLTTSSRLRSASPAARPTHRCCRAQFERYGKVRRGATDRNGCDRPAAPNSDSTA